MKTKRIPNYSDYEIKQFNALKRVESVIMPVFKRESVNTRQLVRKIDHEMMLGLKAAGRNLLQRKIAWGLIRGILIRAARKDESLYVTEQKIRKSIQKTIKMKSAIQRPLLERAERIYTNISEYITGGLVLDYGAGSGILSTLIAQKSGKKVVLMDTVDYNHTDLPLIKIEEGQPIPVKDKSYDTAICILVLHHSDNPEFILDELTRVTRKRLVIIEGYIDEAEIYMMNCFFDWFMNRIGTLVDINVPLNFKTTDQWKEVFRQKNIEMVQEKKLGVEPLIREHHVLYVLDLK
jgi:ubiquinone/menaquinone biosynthesis C-methylase UbiE